MSLVMHVLSKRTRVKVKKCGCVDRVHFCYRRLVHSNNKETYILVLPSKSEILFVQVLRYLSVRQNGCSFEESLCEEI